MRTYLPRPLLVLLLSGPLLLVRNYHFDSAVLLAARFCSVGRNGVAFAHAARSNTVRADSTLNQEVPYSFGSVLRELLVVCIRSETTGVIFNGNCLVRVFPKESHQWREA